jgi:hypothetical protein
VLESLVDGCLEGSRLPAAPLPSVVTAILAWASLIRVCSASAEKPPKTNEWIAPRRAQASIVKTVSGIIGM